jgi:hypothetical protein
MIPEEAEKIVHAWGIHLQYTQEKLLYIFGSSVPESFYPSLRAQ